MLLGSDGQIWSRFRVDFLKKLYLAELRARTDRFAIDFVLISLEMEAAELWAHGQICNGFILTPLGQNELGRAQDSNRPTWY